ncbi:DNA-binding transcriptional LysR family regulator [Sphingobium xenophagum]|uniref:DNA-binding transcriptional LysR family regulator n=1 Tax=Sphingobium xenophagum TaxID=121428 RepID=A0ABU1X7M4_SPHXE|nr:LysR family transcriptional regulator [Sphingobium xenophagum]MDR7157111.1 DNA-binding transcriptional LysR family regulator [Sphingobium xenophagum]
MSKWDGIDEFIAVATTNSFTRAAKSIGMSPTHVSRAIMMLEQRVQAQLFNRTTRTVKLTDTGRIFFERCERIAQERDEAIALVGEQGEPQGELRVTCSTALGERFVAPIIRRFATPHPKLGITIDLSNRIVDLIAEGYDLGIRTGHVTDARLISTQVASRRLYACAAPDYLARAGLPKCVDDLAQHLCIVGTSSTWHFREAGSDRLYHPKGRFQCNSGQAVIEACVAGIGVCQLPEFYVLPYLKHGMVRLILEDLQPPDEPIWAVYPQRRHLLPKIQQVVQCLQLELVTAMS